MTEPVMLHQLCKSLFRLLLAYDIFELHESKDKPGKIFYLPVRQTGLSKARQLAIRQSN